MTQADRRATNEALLSRVRGGDRDAEAKLVDMNRGVVYRLVAERRPATADHEAELVSAGMAALLWCVRRYDPLMGNWPGYVVTTVSQRLRGVRTDEPSEVLAGDDHEPVAPAVPLREPLDTSSLTERESTVLEALVRHESQAEAARETGMRDRQVAARVVRKIRRKLAEPSDVWPFCGDA